MRIAPAVVLTLFISFPACAQAATPCEELKSEIAQKLEAKGVKSYTLEIAGKDQEVEGKVVGTCEGGTKKIVYRRGASSAQAPAADAAKP